MVLHIFQKKNCSKLRKIKENKNTHTQKKNNPLEEILRYNISPQTLFFLFVFAFWQAKNNNILLK